MNWYKIRKIATVEAYHASFNDFDSFEIEPYQLGLHFGDKNAALTRLQGKIAEHIVQHGKYNTPNLKQFSTPVLYKVQLNITNPLKLEEQDRFSQWDAQTIINKLLDDSRFIDEIEDQYDEISTTTEDEQNEWLINFLKNHGYDSIEKDLASHLKQHLSPKLDTFQDQLP